MNVWDEFTWRGLVHQVTDPSLPDLLVRERLSVYVGFDPTADSLHVGHLFQMVNLRRLQLAGHRPIALVGGGTGMIGDPGGRSSERNLLSSDDLEVNKAGIRANLEQVLDFSDGHAVLRDNSEWLGQTRLLDFLRDVGKHFSVNTMIRKESVRARLEQREQGISYTEFSYMLLQAYDFLELFDREGCRLQMGGSDQWGNITGGVDLIRRMRGEEAFGLTTMLVTRADGTPFRKSEASEDNIWLSPHRTSPYTFFQFWVRTEDANVGNFLRWFTLLPRERVEELELATNEHPERREGQYALALEMTTLVHGEAEATRAARAAQVLFSEEIADLDEALLLEMVADAPSSTQPLSVLTEGWPVVDALVAGGLAASKSEARRSVEQGGVYVNNRRVPSHEHRLTAGDLLHGRYLILRKGKRDQHLAVFA